MKPLIREERMMKMMHANAIDEERREEERQNWQMHENANNNRGNLTDEEIAYLFGENE